MITKFLRTLLCLLLVGSTASWGVKNAYQRGGHYYTKQAGKFYELTNTDGTLTHAAQPTTFGRNKMPKKSSVAKAEQALGIVSSDASGAGDASFDSSASQDSAPSSTVSSPDHAPVAAPARSRSQSPVTTVLASAGTPTVPVFSLHDAANAVNAADADADVAAVAVAAPASAPRAPRLSVIDQFSRAPGVRVYSGAANQARIEAEEAQQASIRQLDGAASLGFGSGRNSAAYFPAVTLPNALATANEETAAKVAAATAANAANAANAAAAAAKQARRAKFARGTKWTASALAGIAGVLLTAMSLRVRSKYWHFVQPGTVRSIAADAALERLSPFDRLSVKVVRSLIEKGKGALVGLQNAGNWVGDKASRLTQDAKSKWAAFRANKDVTDVAAEDDEDENLNALLNEYDLV